LTTIELRDKLKPDWQRGYVEMKHIFNLLLVVLMISIVVAAGGCGAEFQLYSLKVSPEVCLTGETVTVSATLNYSGSVEGDYEAELLVDGVIEQTQTLAVEPESSRSVSFALTRDEPGTYVVQIGELTASLTVLEVSNFNLSPAEVMANETVTVSADLQNVTETEATINCRLLCQGSEAAAKDMTLAGGATEAVTFSLSQGTPGMYEVQLGNLSGSFKVLRPAEIEVVSLDIFPNPVRVGEETAIMLSIKNSGDIADTYTANIAVDGVAGGTEEVTVAGGATEKVSFSLLKDSPGSYNIEAGGQEVALRVWQPPDTGTFFLRTYGGSAALEVENRFSDLDIVAVLAKADEPETARIAFYVRAGDTFTARRISHGMYIVYLTIGEEWDNDELKFLTGATYHQYEEELKFVSTAEQKGTWMFKLGPSIPSWQISEDAFPDLGAKSNPA
jgi:hypothetical protein